MKQLLISKEEIVKLTPLDRSIKEYQLNPHSNIKKLFNKWLGLDLYDIVIGDLKEYDAIAYSKVTVYIVGEYAEEDNLVYEMTNVAGNAVVDLFSDCGENWKVADRFVDACLNGLYEELQDWLAWQIGADSAPFLHVRTTGGGQTTQGSDRRGSQGAEENMVRMSGRAWKKAAQESLDVLRVSIKELEVSTDCAILSVAIPECGKENLRNINSNFGYGLEL
jgi:hypothetical protein